MKPAKNDHYSYRLTWSEEDQEHVGLCVEFPSLSWLASSPEAALKGIRSVVADVVQDLKQNGESVPVPVATRHFSGKFVVRVRPDRHRELVLKATEDGVSLNHLVSEKLAT